MKIILISTYELGHQPFGLASPAAWLRRSGAEVTCLDLSRQPLQEDAVRAADVVAFYVPMHTATRLAIRLIEPIRRLNPRAHLCFYGLYAPVNQAYLGELGVETIIGGEFEAALANAIRQLADKHCYGDGSRTTAPAAGLRNPTISLERLSFIPPDRSQLPPLRQYAHLLMPEGGFKVAGYTEASRGCKHLCRHCPIVPVYKGIFRIVQREVVLEDIRQQVDAGAEHITFGDPDFFNGPAHALTIVEALHREFPQLSYDVTIKIEHLLLCREARISLAPTFVPFTPWTSLSGYRALLALVADEDLVENVAPIQLGIRLLIPAGSRLLELDDVRNAIGNFDSSGLVYPWKHADARMDMLSACVQELATAGDRLKRSRTNTFMRIWRAASELAGDNAASGDAVPKASTRTIPHFTEPWYCCAEPTQDQFVAFSSDVRPQTQSDTFF